MVSGIARILNHLDVELQEGYPILSIRGVVFTVVFGICAHILSASGRVLGEQSEIGGFGGRAAFARTTESHSIVGSGELARVEPVSIRVEMTDLARLVETV